jgi:Flp pilus assembly protein CpaB
MFPPDAFWYINHGVPADGSPPSARARPESVLMSEETKTVPWQNKWLMIAAVIAAVVAVVLNYLYVSSIENTTDKSLIPVYRATRTIEPGRPLKEGDVEEGENIRVPAPRESDRRPFVRAGVGGELPAIKDLVVRRRIDKGEPIRWDMFTEYGGGSVAHDAIKYGARAVTLDINGRFASPLVVPGSKVDLVGVLQMPGPIGPDGKPTFKAPTAEIMLKQAEVVAVGSVWKPDDIRPGAGSNYTKLTIQVPENMVADLMTILNIIPPPGVVLRNPSDPETEDESAKKRRLEEFKNNALKSKIGVDIRDQ